MTPETWARAKELYFELAGTPAARRMEELSRRGADEEVRRVVRSLLEGGSPPEGFLEQPALGASFDALSALDAPDGEGPDPAIGVRLGPFVIQSRIGLGGMGAVYLASRADGQFEQRVAVKIVKRGLDTEDIVHRFRRERQLLAHLQHPNIAALVDGGVTPDGRPYLAMEHVDGLPIDRYCAEHRLTVEKRLRLFCTVCAAVHYAHQNLVVHRDLKPGNILVTADGTPKLLDFGIAKVLGADDDRPDVTASERRMLTPGYASPEQVLGLPVSTASDIYSLGVVLYNLLTGEAPYRFTTGAHEEVRRVVCELDPPPPALTASKTRTGDAPPGEDLSRRLRGDLDNIVLMAMRKEPDRRYASAEQLAADLRRHLDGHPVIARPSTFGYRAAKFVRRNAIGVVAAAAVALAMIAGAAGVAWQWRIARAQRDAAIIAHREADEVNAFLQSILQSANAYSGSGHDVTVRELLEGAAERARDDLRDHPVVLSSALGAIGSAYTSLGVYEEAEPLLRQALEIARQHPAVTTHLHDRLNDMGTLLYHTGELEEAEALVREALEHEVAWGGPRSEGVGRTLNNLGAVLRASDRLDEAETTLRQALEIRREALGPEDIAVAETLNNLGNVLRLNGDLAGAEELVTESLAIREQSLGEAHALTAQSLSNLAVLVHTRGDLDRAEPLYTRALRLLEVAVGPTHPSRASTIFAYAMLKRARAANAEAEPLLREAIELRTATMTPGDPRMIGMRLELAACLADLGRRDEAIAELGATLEAADEATKPAIRERLAQAYEAAGRPEEAAKYR